MKRIIFTVLIGMFIAINAVADTPHLPSNRRVQVSKPRALKRDILKSLDLEKFVKTGKWGQDDVVDAYWNVWSDRSHNTTYNGPSESSGKYKELEFNQAVRIADIQKGYALVYEEPMQGLKHPIISERAVNEHCLGWIKMDNLLLWESCPTNDKGIYHKALIVANAEGWKKAGNNNFNKCYKNPVTQDGVATVKTDMKFYFVMKEQGGFVLLGRSSKMDAGEYDKQLYSWVSKNTYVPWNQRTCLEGNWDETVAKNLMGTQVGVLGYDKEGKEILGTHITLGKENGVTNNPATKYRFPKERLRFPLLNNDDKAENGKYEITAFATPTGEVGYMREDSVTIDDPTKSDKIKEEMMKAANRINLIVVIDGTSSMENYYKAMQDAIQKAYETFGLQNGKTVKAGVVIYRDYADGIYMTEKLEMTDPNSEKLREFLANGGKYGIKSSSKDRTNAEALYQGLNLALDNEKMGYSSESSNLMFVVGDCGNDANDHKIDQKDIIDKCAKLKINLVAFQVRNKDDVPFNDFRRQMGAILRGNLKKQYDQLIKWDILSDGIVLKSIEGVKTPVMGAMRNADKGEDMSPHKLNEIIKDNYIKFEDVIESKKHYIQTIVEDFEQIDGLDVAEKNMTQHFLQQNFTPEQVEIIKKRGLITAFNGHTDKKNKNGQDYWKPVLFITGEEFASMMETFKVVYMGATKGNRKAYVDALKKMIQTILPGITDDEMYKMDIKKVMNMVSGLIVKTKSLNSHSIQEIQEEKIVSPAEFDRMISDFKQKYEYLDNIRTSNYEFSVVQQGVRWYWLPVEALP